MMNNDDNNNYWLLAQEVAESYLRNVYASFQG